jgi:hypothetical protein
VSQFARAHERIARLLYLGEEAAYFANLVEGWHSTASSEPSDRDRLFFRKRPDLGQVTVLT